MKLLPIPTKNIINSSKIGEIVKLWFDESEPTFGGLMEINDTFEPISKTGDDEIKECHNELDLKSTVTAKVESANSCDFTTKIIADASQSKSPEICEIDDTVEHIAVTITTSIDNNRTVDNVVDIVIEGVVVKTIDNLVDNVADIIADNEIGSVIVSVVNSIIDNVAETVVDGVIEHLSGSVVDGVTESVVVANTEGAANNVSPERSSEDPENLAIYALAIPAADEPKSAKKKPKKKRVAPPATRVSSRIAAKRSIDVVESLAELQKSGSENVQSGIKIAKPEVEKLQSGKEEESEITLEKMQPNIQEESNPGVEKLQSGIEEESKITLEKRQPNIQGESEPGVEKLQSGIEEEDTIIEDKVKSNIQEESKPEVEKSQSNIGEDAPCKENDKTIDASMIITDDTVEELDLKLICEEITTSKLYSAIESAISSSISSVQINNAGILSAVIDIPTTETTSITSDATNPIQRGKFQTSVDLVSQSDKSVSSSICEVAALPEVLANPPTTACSITQVSAVPVTPTVPQQKCHPEPVDEVVLQIRQLTEDLLDEWQNLKV